MLEDGPSVDRHHLVPRSYKGVEQFLVHRVCHQKIHSLFTEKELASTYHTWEALRAHPDMQVFMRWVAKKPIEFYDRNDRAGRKGPRKGRYR